MPPNDLILNHDLTVCNLLLIVLLTLINQMDVQSAFLCDDMHKKLYIQLPQSSFKEKNPWYLDNQFPSISSLTTRFSLRSLVDDIIITKNYDIAIFTFKDSLYTKFCIKDLSQLYMINQTNGFCWLTCIRRNGLDRDLLVKGLNRKCCNI